MGPRFGGKKAAQESCSVTRHSAPLEWKGESERWRDGRRSPLRRRPRGSTPSARASAPRQGPCAVVTLATCSVTNDFPWLQSLLSPNALQLMPLLRRLRTTRPSCATATAARTALAGKGRHSLPPGCQIGYMRGGVSDVFGRTTIRVTS